MVALLESGRALRGVGSGGERAAEGELVAPGGQEALGVVAGAEEGALGVAGGLAHHVDDGLQGGGLGGLGRDGVSLEAGQLAGPGGEERSRQADEVPPAPPPRPPEGPPAPGS